MGGPWTDLEVLVAWLRPRHGGFFLFGYGPRRTVERIRTCHKASRQVSELMSGCGRFASIAPEPRPPRRVAPAKSPSTTRPPSRQRPSSQATWSRSRLAEAGNGVSKWSKPPRNAWARPWPQKRSSITRHHDQPESPGRAMRHRPNARRGLDAPRNGTDARSIDSAGVSPYWDSWLPSIRITLATTCSRL